MADSPQIRLTELSSTAPTTANTSRRTSFEGELGEEQERSPSPPRDRKVAEGECYRVFTILLRPRKSCIELIDLPFLFPSQPSTLTRMADFKHGYRCFVASHSFSQL